jgi:hypothetical protein
MVFTSTQAQQFDQMRMQADKVEQLSLFVTDETAWYSGSKRALAGIWPRSQTYAELATCFSAALHQERYEACLS